MNQNAVESLTLKDPDKFNSEHHFIANHQEVPQAPSIQFMIDGIHIKNSHNCSNQGHLHIHNPPATQDG